MILKIHRDNGTVDMVPIRHARIHGITLTYHPLFIRVIESVDLTQVDYIEVECDPDS